MIKKTYAYLAALISVIMASLGPSVFMILIRDMDRDLGIAYFLFFGGLFLLGTTVPPELRERRKLAMVFRGAVLLRLALASILTVVVFFLFTVSMQVGTITETSILARLNPLFLVAFSALFLGEKIKNWTMAFVAFCVCFSGAAMFAESNLERLAEANAWFLVLGILTAIAIAVQRAVYCYLQKYDRVSGQFISSVPMMIGSLCMLPFIGRGTDLIPSPKQFLIILFLGVVTIALPAYLELIAYEKLGSISKISFLSYLIPIFSGFCAYFVNQERDFSYGFLGVGFLTISVGAVIMNRNVRTTPS